MNGVWPRFDNYRHYGASIVVKREQRFFLRHLCSNLRRRKRNKVFHREKMKWNFSVNTCVKLSAAIVLVYNILRSPILIWNNRQKAKHVRNSSDIKCTKFGKWMQFSSQLWIICSKGILGAVGVVCLWRKMLAKEKTWLELIWIIMTRVH